MITEKNYDVLRFLEHNGKCRIVMDCVPGSLLIHRVSERGRINRDILIGWCTMLALELEKYHRCRNGQCYRYLNPYSVLVTQEDQILLLDLNAEDNKAILREMQSPAMRNHFIKPVVLIKENTRLTYDIYGLGKTIQFMLANTESYIKLSRREIFLLSGIIEKCLGKNPKKQYENIKQIQKELARLKYMRLRIGRT